eukprot:TRINITY_DN3743_c0_g1_i1.p1 TRINITY_DN3743_c0_g1~~TRINITY_DN3743_c0_g1_i1.p1  ORF type:complete len:463 (-),score=92.95 TRINITY_DN3743_c0_g1_i1:53-1441(-)
MTSSSFSLSSSLKSYFFLFITTLFLLNISSLSYAEECGLQVGAEVTCEVPAGTADLSTASIDTRSFNGITYGSYRLSQWQVKTLFPWTVLPGSVRLRGVVTPRDSQIPHIFTTDLTRNGVDMTNPYLFCSPLVVRSNDGSSSSGNIQGTNQVVFPTGNTTVTCTLEFNSPIAYIDTLQLPRSSPSNSELSICYDDNCQSHPLGSTWTEAGSSIYYTCQTLLAPFAYGKPSGCNNSGILWPDQTATTIGSDIYYCNVSAVPPYYVITKPAECNITLPQTVNNVTYDCVLENGTYQLDAVSCNTTSANFAPNQIQLVNGLPYFCNTDIPALIELNTTYCEVLNQTFSVFSSLVIDNIIYQCFGQGDGKLVVRSTGCRDQFGSVKKAGEISEDTATGQIHVCGYDTFNKQYFFAPLTCVDCTISGENVPIGKLTIVGSYVYTCFVSYTGQVSTQLVGSLSPCLGY